MRRTYAMLIDAAPVFGPAVRSAATAEPVFARLYERLTALVAAPVLTEAAMVDLMTVYNEVAYTVNCVEVFGDPEDLERLRALEKPFYDDPALDRAVLDRLLVLRCQDPEAETARTEYVDQLRIGMVDHEAHAERTADLLAAGRAEQARFDEALTGLLGKLGVKAAAGPSAVFDRLVEGTGKPSVREKLVRAREALRGNRLPALVDDLVAERRAASRAGIPNALSQTSMRLRTSPEEIEAFLDSYLEQAVARAEAGEPESTDGESSDTRLDFDLKLCLDFLFDVTRAVFGVRFTVTSPTEVDCSADFVVAQALAASGEPVGAIVFDLWDGPRKRISANHTFGIRNRTDWNGVRQRPEAVVSCRFPREPGRLRFPHVRTVFHEFGHALNHLLVRHRLPYLSGLEYLPPERREYLSMWTEKWIHHPGFAERVGANAAPGTDPIASLAADLAAELRRYRRGYVERGVVAFVDFDVHRTGRSLAESYALLDERHGISAHCAFGEVPGQLLQPRFLQHPGLAFAYLWGAAFSSAGYAPLHSVPLDRISPDPDLDAFFAPCFDFALPSAVPDGSALFAFHDPAVASTIGDRPWSA